MPAPRPIALSEALPVHLQRLYRAHVEPSGPRGVERTAFVEASSHHCACKKIAAAVAALEHQEPMAVASRIYNCISACELLEEGASKDVVLRVFETGWSGHKAVCFVTEPLFLLAEPSALIRKWASIPHDAQP